MSAPAPPSPASPRTVLVLGANGFLAGFIVDALHAAGWTVRRAVREPRAAGEVRCDLRELREPGDWAALLDGVAAVVNVAGILRESGSDTYAAIHHDAPLALAQACLVAKVGRFVQISALGEPADGEFIASKHRFDEALLALPLSASVLRPSVVYSTAGAWGGTALLRAMAAVPGLLPLPGDGRWLIQPLAAEDLAALVVCALDNQVEGIFEVGGPQVLSLRDYLRQWRRWLDLNYGFELRVPLWLIHIQVTLFEWLGRGPMGRSTWRMLKRGNVCPDNAAARLQEHFGFQPGRLEQALAARASQAVDRQLAQLYLLAPVLGFGVVLLFLLSAWAGFVTPAAQINGLTAGSLLQDLSPVLLARIAAVLDLLLALALLMSWQTRRVLLAMLVLVGAYTLSFGLVLPGLWLDPLGGLAKNLVILPALFLLWVLAERRR